jgi:hypothetical protein
MALSRQERIAAYLAAARRCRMKREPERQTTSIPLDPERGIRLYLHCLAGQKKQLAQTLLSLSQAGFRTDSPAIQQHLDLSSYERFARLWRETFAELPPMPRDVLDAKWKMYRQHPLPPGFPEIPLVFIVSHIDEPPDGTADIVHGQFSPTGAYRFSEDALAGLSDQEIKAVIAHELAHGAFHAVGGDYRDETAVDRIALSWGHPRIAAQ